MSLPCYVPCPLPLQLTDPSSYVCYLVLLRIPSILIQFCEEIPNIALFTACCATMTFSCKLCTLVIFYFPSPKFFIRHPICTVYKKSRAADKIKIVSFPDSSLSVTSFTASLNFEGYYIFHACPKHLFQFQL